jgi:hypothetical protein
VSSLWWFVKFNFRCEHLTYNANLINIQYESRINNYYYSAAQLTKQSKAKVKLSP